MKVIVDLHCWRNMIWFWHSTCSHKCWDGHTCLTHADAWYKMKNWPLGQKNESGFMHYWSCPKNQLKETCRFSQSSMSTHADPGWPCWYPANFLQTVLPRQDRPPALNHPGTWTYNPCPSIIIFSQIGDHLFHHRHRQRQTSRANLLNHFSFSI